MKFKIKHDGYVFKLSTKAVVNEDRIYGYYKDRNGVKQRILRKSVYGQTVRTYLINEAIGS